MSQQKKPKIILTLTALLLGTAIPVATLQAVADRDVPTFKTSNASPQPYRSGFDAMAAKAGSGRIRVIITLNANTVEGKGVGPASLDTEASILNAAQARVIETMRKISITEIKQIQGTPYIAASVTAEQLKALGATGQIADVEQDNVAEPSLGQSLGIIQAPAYWATNGHKGQGQVVAILDTGVNSAHPFLTGRLQSEACFSTNGGGATAVCSTGSTALGSGAPCTITSCWHGTHVAGIAVGKQNGAPAINGVAPEAKYVSVQVFSNFSGSLGAYDSDILAGLNHVKNLKLAGINIASVNMSLGGGAFTSPCTGSLNTMLGLLRTLGVAPVVSSGNNGFASAISSPACSPNAITVASSDKTNAMSFFSNLSPEVDLVAPGGAIQSSANSSYSVASGTSMAAPHIAGAYALLRQRFPCYPLVQFDAKLKATGIPISRSGTAGTFPLIQLTAARSSLAPLWKSYLCKAKLDDPIKINDAKSTL